MVIQRCEDLLTDNENENTRSKEVNQTSRTEKNENLNEQDPKSKETSHIYLDIPEEPIYESIAEDSLAIENDNKKQSNENSINVCFDEHDATRQNFHDFVETLKNYKDTVELKQICEKTVSILDEVYNNIFKITYIPFRIRGIVKKSFYSLLDLRELWLNFYF